MADNEFSTRYGPWAVVAGGSEGIGAAFADRIAAQGINLVLLARRPGPLDQIAARLRSDHGVEVRTAAVDLTGGDVVAETMAVVDGVDVGLLVYNAGAVHGAELFVQRPIEDALHLIDMNCRTVALLTHHFGGTMAERGRGGIVLMTSISSAAGAAYTAAYNATKAFDLILAEGLWIELGQVGVDVIAVPAGLTDTPAMRTSGIIGGDSAAMDPVEVADAALEALGRGGPLVVPGGDNQAAASFLWPVERSRMVEAMTAGAAGLYGLPPLTAPTYAAGDAR